MESLSADLFDERLKLFVQQEYGVFSTKKTFSPSKLWAHAGFLLDSFASEFEPHIKMTEEGVWSVEVNGSPAYCGLDLKYLIARSFATSTLLGELNANKPYVSDAQSHGRNLPLPGSWPFPEPAEKDGL